MQNQIFKSKNGTIFELVETVGEICVLRNPATDQMKEVKRNTLQRNYEAVQV